MKELKLIIQPKVIDHLGIKMYQKPVDVIAEFIANSWDSDSETVIISINDESIIVSDKGCGMTYQECQDYFLTVGRNRRKATGKEFTEKGRPVLGRKGIGKFSGFGIARTIKITTVSEGTGETTSFEMDIQGILEYDMSGKEEKPIKVIDYREPSDENKVNHGTTVSLLGLDGSSIDEDKFKEELSRRFILSQNYGDFKILVNEKELPESFGEKMEFVFPRDLLDEDRAKMPDFIEIDDKGWAVEQFNGNDILWRIGFCEEPIETEELRGMSIFAKGKMAQKPFFFDLAGGISGQYGIEYMTGQISMDFIDEGANDLIATERQRINLQTAIGKKIKEWGIDRIKFLCSLRKKRRSEKRMRELEDKLEGFKDRLEALPKTERKTVKSVLIKIATFDKLGKKRYREWCDDILTSWETGRLRELITEISEAENLDEQKLLDMLSEADVLTALNIAESVKTKILAIGELKQRVLSGELENKVRDYIYEHSWIIHPRWDNFSKERSVKNLIEDIGNKHLTGDGFKGRVDLALSAGSELLLVEFMRPGVELDTDHLDRLNYYVMAIRSSLEKETGKTVNKLGNAYLIADTKKDIALMRKRIDQLEKDGILVMTWNTLIEEAIKQWVDYLDLLKQRNPRDTRIQAL